MHDYQHLSDEALVKEIQNSEVNAFRVLYFRYYERIGNYIFSRINSVEQTKDILQDIFSWIWQNRHKLVIKTSLAAYLYRMAFNITVNFYHKRSREQAYIAYQLSRQDIVSNHFSDIKIDIETAINSLPPKWYQVFELSRFEGFKNSEIAEILNISIKTVESRMTKALKALRKIVYQ